MTLTNLFMFSLLLMFSVLCIEITTLFLLWSFSKLTDLSCRK